MSKSCFRSSYTSSINLLTTWHTVKSCSSQEMFEFYPPCCFKTVTLESACQRRLDSRPQSIMGTERLIPRAASLTVYCRGVNISLTKPIWKLSNDKSVRYSVKTAYCCIVAILIMTCVLL
jgi:hypothetical protein